MYYKYAKMTHPGIVRSVLLLVTAIISFSFTTPETKSSRLETLYHDIVSSTEKPDYKVFELAIEGYSRMKESGKLGDKNLLTIIDFSISSNRERMWVIDLENKTVLYHTLVAHGRNTGDEFARHFSNVPESKKSSLGFYVTGNTYSGKHGLSLHLEGVEKGINNNARNRSIVMHGADYVSHDFIKKYGRLGRSLGCPALPESISGEVIPLLADNTCVFIFYPDKDYLDNSGLIH